MKKIILTLLGALMLAGCSACGISAESIGKEMPVLEQKMKDQLNADLAKLGKQQLNYEGIKFYFYDEPHVKSNGETQDGFCSQTLFEKKVSVRAFIIKSNTYLTFVHEIGHCVLGKGHDDSQLNIMNSTNMQEMVNIFANDENAKLEMIKKLFD